MNTDFSWLFHVMMVIATVTISACAICVYNWAYENWEELHSSAYLFFRATMPAVFFFMGWIFFLVYLEVVLGIRDVNGVLLFPIAPLSSFVLSSALLAIGMQRGKMNYLVEKMKDGAVSPPPS